MGTSTKISKIDYNKIYSDNNSVLENNVKVGTFIHSLERHCVKFDMTYFIKNFPILTAREDFNDKVERFNNRKTINLLEDWD